MELQHAGRLRRSRTLPGSPAKGCRPPLPPLDDVSAPASPGLSILPAARARCQAGQTVRAEAQPAKGRSSASRAVRAGPAERRQAWASPARQRGESRSPPQPAGRPPGAGGWLVHTVCTGCMQASSARLCGHLPTWPLPGGAHLLFLRLFRPITGRDSPASWQVAASVRHELACARAAIQRLSAKLPIVLPA